jgi:hypothetical protein
VSHPVSSEQLYHVELTNRDDDLTGTENATHNYITTKRIKM